jgi:glycosyltransferase involved in cell wall biosynthesis
MEIMKSSRPMASVIIDTYNSAPFIEEAIESVLTQTFQEEEMEIIVVDDGSTDDTAVRVRKYGDKIKYIYKMNGGQASAMNAGFENSRGEIIFLLDADDYFHSNKLQTICDIYHRYDCNSVFNNLTIIGEGVRNGDGYKDDSALCFSEDAGNSISVLSLDRRGRPPFCLSPTSGQSYKREMCKSLFPIPDILVASPDLYLYAFALLHHCIHYVHKPLTYYRKHPLAFTHLLSKDLRRMELDLQLRCHVVDLLRNADPGGRAAPLIHVIENQTHWQSICLAKKRGRLLEMFKHLFRCRIEGPFFFKLFSVPHLLLFLLAPERVYEELKRVYRTSGLKRRMIKILKNHFPF